MAEPARNEIGNPGLIQTPAAGVNVSVPGNGNVGVAVNPGDNQWRYCWHNNNGGIWTTNVDHRNGNAWVNYEPAVAAVPAVVDASQPVVVDANQPAVGYTPGAYGYTTGYRGYYGPVYRGGYYYGPGPYYGQPGISLGLGFGRGLRIGW